MTPDLRLVEVECTQRCRMPGCLVRYMREGILRHATQFLRASESPIARPPLHAARCWRPTAASGVIEIAFFP